MPIFVKVEIDADWGDSMAEQLPPRSPSGFPLTCIIPLPEQISQASTNAVLRTVWPDDDATGRHDMLPELIAFVSLVDPDAFESVIADGARRSDYRDVYSYMAMDTDGDGHRWAVTRMDQQRQWGGPISPLD